MRRFAALFFAILLAVSLFGCGQTATEPESETTLRVPKPISWADIDAVPVATADMSEEELRQICVDFFRLQLTFQWTPKEDFAYSITTYEKNPELTPGTVYAGCPYISPSNTGNLYRVMEFYDTETGVLDTTAMDVQDFAYLIGNDCVTGPFWGWGRVVNSFLKYSNSYFTQEYGCIPIGPYTYENITQWSQETNTKSVCDDNGAQIMYQSYAAAKPADGLYTQWNEPKNSHMRMVSGVPTVVLDDAGNIDGGRSFLTYIDQGSTWDLYNLDGTSALVQGGVDVRVSFRNLYDNGYLPFTWAELIGEDPVEPATLTTNMPVPEEMTVNELRLLQITTNYTLSHLTLELRDETGNVTYTKTLYTQQRLEQRAAVGGLVDVQKITELLNPGPQQATLTCRISTGQLLTVFEGLLNP